MPQGDKKREGGIPPESSEGRSIADSPRASVRQTELRGVLSLLSPPPVRFARGATLRDFDTTKFGKKFALKI